MPLIFKLVGSINSKILEIKKDFEGEIRLSDIFNIFQDYGINMEDFEHIKFVTNSETIKSNEKKFKIEKDDNFVIFTLSANKEIKEKLINIFSESTTNQEDKTNDDNKMEEKDEKNIADEKITKNIDNEEKNTIPVLSDEVINEMNIKSAKLFESEDFKHLIRIYYTNQDLMKTFFSFVNNGDIVKIDIPKDKTKNFDTEIEVLKSLGINESNEKIHEVLTVFNGHLNLSLRALLVRKSLENNNSV